MHLSGIQAMRPLMSKRNAKRAVASEALTSLQSFLESQNHVYLVGRSQEPYRATQRELVPESRANPACRQTRISASRALSLDRPFLGPFVLLEKGIVDFLIDAQ